MRILSLIFFFCVSLPSLATSWAEAQQSRDYLAAKKYLADFLPELAIPRIKTLLSRPNLDQTAKSTLLTLLGEAQIRTALDQKDPNKSRTLADALKTLDDRSLREFSPSHLWRSYALTNLGRLHDAIGELEKIDHSSMLEQANVQMASLMISIGDLTGAKSKLEPLLKSEGANIVKKAHLNLISVAISEKQADQANKYLATYAAENPREEALKNYLTGLLQLLRKERLQAAGTFQNLLETPDIAQLLPTELFHEATLALADSLALENNEEAGATSLLQTLEKFPESPRIEGIFARLKTWAPKIESASIATKLKSWIPAINGEPQLNALFEFTSAGALSFSSTQEILSPRSLYSLEFIASSNLQSDNSILFSEGFFQMKQLQLAGRIDSPLIHRSLLELGIAFMKDKKQQEALTRFNLLYESTNSPLLKIYAKALAGQASFALDKPEQASEAYLEAAKISARLRNSSLRALSELNAGIALLATTKSKALDQMTESLRTPEAKSFLILERGLFLNVQNDSAARDLLSSFIADFPASPRKDEALLALAENSVFSEPADPELTAFVKTQLPSLKFDFESQTSLEGRRILVLLALGLGQDQATDFVNKAPKDPLSPRILFRLGQTQRSVDPIGKAYATFEKFLTDYPESEFADPARYLSARSSASSGTESAQKNSIIRFRELIDGKGPLANEAAISLASLLIEREQQKDALDVIVKHLKTKGLNDSDRRRLLILSADASGQLGRHEKVLENYAQLLNMKDLPDSTRNRASYQRGRAFEQLGRKAEALESYLSVVNRDFDPSKTTSLEWTWFDKCGIEGALALLEREERWRAAISLAEKLGKSGSPRAKDAEESAKRIGLEQRIWRDR